MNFDLNIDNYSRDELIQMFELPPNFDKNIIEIKESKLRENIFNNKSINGETKEKTINFLIKAKTKLLDDSSENFDKLPYKVNNFLDTSSFFDFAPSKMEENTGDHMVQIRNDKKYISTSVSDFYAGIINPLKKKLTRKNLNIDSRFRENYYSTSSTNFNINLPLNIENVVQLQLSSIELPISYFTVSKNYGNNFFSITVNLTDTTSSSTVIQIAEGNYSQFSIIDAINAALTNAGTPFSYVSFLVNLSLTFTVNYTGTGQVLVGPNSTASGNVASIELNFQADRFGVDDRTTQLPLKLGWLLGFRNGIYTGNANYISEGIVDTSGPRYFYLVLDDYNNNVNNGFYSAFNSSIMNNNILARITLGPINFNVIRQNNLTTITLPREYFGPVNLQTMNVQLIDEYGRVVDLNNMDFSFCLSITTCYDL